MNHEAPDVDAPFPSALETVATRPAGDDRAVLDALAALKRLEPRLGAFLDYDEEEARDAAARVGGGRLAGVPIAVKDNISTRGLVTTCASRALRGYRPPYDATCVARIRECGGIVLGKTNMDEFAMGSSCENSAFHPTVNPWGQGLSPGGSSGGSAAAVAAGIVPLALGSDTGGSIRQPAAMCGVLGLRPTYGLVSRYGLVAFGSSLDQVGPIARDARDAALLMAVIAGHDPRDSTSADRVAPDFMQDIEGGVTGMSIGLPQEYFGEGLDEEVRGAVLRAAQFYESQGASVTSVSMPHTAQAVATYYIVAMAEASSNLARYDGIHYGARAENAGTLEEVYTRTRTEGFGAEVRRRVLLGAFVLSTGYHERYYTRALRARRLIAEDFDRAFSRVDFLLSPTTPTAAFKLGSKRDDPLQMYLCDVYTVAASLAGIPALSLPAGFTAGGLPIGMQIMGPRHSDAGVLRVARAFERAHDYYARVPPGVLD